MAMNEQEWLSCTDLEKMLQSLGGRVTERKLRLFGVGCCRRVWRKFPRELRDYVEVAERHADGLASNEDLQRAWHAQQLMRDYRFADQTSAVGWLLWGAVEANWLTPQEATRHVAFWIQRVGGADERQVQCNLLRDLVGNPFALRFPEGSCVPPGISDIQRLAQWAYENRAFGCLPILADALEEAGCSDATILSHLRGPGPHVRGCWVVDLILDKN
jgi:hypothetical protein